MSKKSIIYVGSKPTMNYILAVVTQINHGASSIILKARGRAINHAVDVAEIVRNSFIPDMDIINIEIATEEVTERNGFSTNVSLIEIELKKDDSIADIRKS
ncbi:MAG: DNA-binding protein Alba [archaeon]|nr:DNA-binding protein Alba [archaeon]